MDKVLELAKQAGAVSYTNRHYPDRPYRTFGPEELQKFYTLARADLEAENAELWKAREEPLKQVELYVAECNRLERERDAAMAENAKLREALSNAIPYIGQALAEHDNAYGRHPATEPERASIQKDLDAARAALGEK